MKKSFLLYFTVILIITLLIGFNLSHFESKKSVVKYHEFVKTELFSKQMNLTKKQRRAIGIPPNAYLEQLHVLQADPKLLRPTPEKVHQLQKLLSETENTNRVPGDGMDNIWHDRGPNNVGGRSRALVFDPNDGKRVIAASVTGGIWINTDITDQDTKWRQANGVPSNISVTCLTIDPLNPNILYAGTGEVSTGRLGNGIYKSVDGGNSWVNIFGSSTDDIANNFACIQDIIAWVNPSTNKTEVFFGSDSGGYINTVRFPDRHGINTIGLYRSIDGENFTKVLAIDKAPESFAIGANNKLWMGTRFSHYLNRGGGFVYATLDGVNWQEVIDLGFNGRVRLACSSQNDQLIYALCENRSDNTIPVKIIRTDNGFASTVDLTPPADSDQTIPAHDFTRGQSFYDLAIAVDPETDDRVFVGGINLFKSDEKGINWVKLSSWHTQIGAQPYVHADQHAIVFSKQNPKDVLFANDGGVFYSANKGLSPQARNNGLNITQFYKAQIHKTTNDFKIIAGAQDNGTNFIQSVGPDGSGSANEIAGGDGGWCFVDSQDEYMVSSYVFNTFKYHTIFGVEKYTIVNDQQRGLFINTAGLDSDQNILFTNNSRSGGFEITRFELGPTSATQTVLTDPLLNNVPTNFRVSPYTSQRLLVGLANGRLLQIDQSADVTPTFSTIGDPNWIGAISDICYGRNEDEIIVTFHNFGVESIWYTKNHGQTWINKEGDLPNIPVNCVLQNPFNRNEVIIGTQLGVWYTNNFNETSPKWQRSNNGMKDVMVTSFDYRSSDQTVVASTYGRGVFTGNFWSCGSHQTIWDGNSWSNGQPTKKSAVEFTGDFQSTQSLEMCSLKISNQASIIVNKGHTLNIGSDITIENGASLTLEDKSALVQFKENAINTGTIIVKKKSLHLIKDEFDAWSSPVSNQILSDLSPNTDPNAFFEYNYNGNSPTTYQPIAPTNTLEKAKAYFIQSPTNWSNQSASPYEGIFKGSPNNGTISITIGEGINLLGNPYPCPISPYDLLAHNKNIHTLYFWDHQSMSTNTANHYATYTLLGSVAANQLSDGVEELISISEGIYLKSTSEESVEFKNYFKRAEGQTIKTDELIEKHRFWLNFNKKGTNVSYNQILIGYLDGATNAFDQSLDGYIFDNGNTKEFLYSYSGTNHNDQLVIQARTLPFDQNDIVPLGYQVNTQGDYQISFDHKDLFFNDQYEILLKDKDLDVTHPIEESPYEFTSQSGQFNDRFEIIYKEKTKGSTSNEFIIYSNQGVLSILTPADNLLKDVSIFDLAGQKLYYNETVNTNELFLSRINLRSQILIIRVGLSDGTSVDKMFYNY